MRVVLLTLVIALAVPAGAGAALQRDVVLDVDQAGPVEVDVDRDGVVERVSTAPHPTDGFLRRPLLEHVCSSGGSPTRVIGPYQERNAVQLLRIRGAAGPPLLAVFASTGATGRAQTTWVHRLGPERDANGCAWLRTVFRFPHRTQRTPKPPRGTAAGSFSSQAREVAGEVWFRTFEGLYRRTDGGCCPSFVRTIDWKPRGDRYVRAKTRVRRLPRP